MTDTEPLIISADKIRAGDYVHEYGAVVTSVVPSERYLGVREVEFEGQPGTFFLHFLEWLHVIHPVAQGPDDEDDDGQQHDTRDESWDW